MSQELTTLKVQRVDDLAKMYIVEYEGKLYRVHMVPEQVGKGNPGEIVCTIQKSGNSYIIAQDMPTLLRRHYKEGDEVTYRIEKITSSYYFLTDELGYHTYLDNKYKINPTITPKLRCRIKSISNKRVNVELIEKISIERSQFTIGFEHVRTFFADDIDCADSITALLLADDVLGSFDSECHRWIHSVCQEKGDDITMLKHIRQTCLNVLEGSNILNDCNENEREVLEERFTTLIEQLAYYIHALEFVAEGKEGENIEELLHKLQATGYAFHPKKRFYIMMCIFLIKSKDEDGRVFMDRMMPEVFDTLRSSDITNWKRQPFKIVWIKLLEFFIQSLSNDEDRLSLDKSALSNMVQSLALQYNLTEVDDELMIDSMLNLAMLYRYCTKVGVINPQRMLDIAFHTLIGAIQEEPRMINYTSDPDRMVNIIYNQVNGFTPDILKSLRYEGKDADILIENDSIRIVPKEYDPEDCYDLVPDYMELWNNLQVLQFAKHLPIGKANRQTIRPYKTLWNNVENNLIIPEKKRKAKTEESKPRIGDRLGIIVTKQTAAETPTFECKIVDPDDIVGKGTIRMADMVGYATPSVGLFSFENGGKPMIFDADVVDIDSQGNCVFSAKELIDTFCDDYRYNKIKYIDKVYCVVTGGNTLTPFYAVSQQGLSFTVRYADEDTPIQMPKGTVIEVANIEAGKHGFATAQFVRMAPEIMLTLADAFGNLMRHYSNGDIYEEAEFDEDMVAPDIIEKSKVKEMMNIIDSVASLENDYIKSYNYLGFCKLVAHIIEDEQQLHYYESKMALIELLYEFDVNYSISETLINKFQDSNSEFFSQNSALYSQFRKLQIISYLDKEEHNEELCEIAIHSDDDLAQLAQLIISYNFMKKTGMSAQATEIQERIKELLKLQKKENPKKDYGQETFTKEFKSSIVCPPDNKQRPDLARQTHKIMEEICAFLNAEGGTLYIGVDDKTHLERGIDADLKNPAFEGSKDKYDIYVRNKINQMLVPGEVADHYISTYFDEEAHTPVYVIDIKPCPQPISIDGVFYERRGTSSRHVSEEYQSTFISNRLQMASTIEQNRIEEILEAAKPVEEPVIKKAEVSKAPSHAYEYSSDFEAIKTSLIRSVRHHNDDIQPDDLSLYVNIFEDNTYSITPQLYSGCLSLGIYDEEQEGYLVVVYATGEIARISLDELLEKDQWTPYSINNKSRIVFVSPAMPGDILSILYHSKNTDYYRFFTVDNLDHGTFNTCMRPFYSGPIDEIIDCEVLPLTNLNQYKNFLDLDNDKPGADSKKTDGKKAVKAIKTLLAK